MEEFLWIILIAVAAFLLAPWASERMRKRMDVEEARVNAPGEFAELSLGVTHYRWFGPERGPKVVCVHGLTTPCYGYEGLATELAEAGCRVLTFDLYGRGYSDPVYGEHTVDFYLQQLDELLNDQNVEDRFVLCGYSMGGMLAAAFASRSPDRVSQLVLLGAGGVARADLGIPSFIANSPYLLRWTQIVLGGARPSKIYLHRGRQ